LLQPRKFFLLALVLVLVLDFFDYDYDYEDDDEDDGVAAPAALCSSVVEFVSAFISPSAAGEFKKVQNAGLNRRPVFVMNRLGETCNCQLAPKSRFSHPPSLGLRPLAIDYRLSAVDHRLAIGNRQSAIAGGVGLGKIKNLKTNPFFAKTNVVADDYA